MTSEDTNALILDHPCVALNALTATHGFSYDIV